jgi:hypothetical protein
VVAGTEVELGEVFGAMQLIQKLINDGDGEGILDGDGVQGVIVDAETPRPIGFLDKEDRRRERRRATADESLVHGNALAFQLIFV